MIPSRSLSCLPAKTRVPRSGANKPRRRRLSTGLAALIALALGGGLLAGCATLGSRSDLYSLSAPTSTGAGPTVSWQLLVDSINAPAGLDTTSIAVRQRPASLDYYEGVAWTDRAPVMMQRLMVETFENTGRITGVGRQSVAIRANFILRCELRDFQSDTTGSGPPVAVVRTSCALIRMPERDIIARESHTGQAPAAGTRFAEVIAAFNRATDDALTQIARWALSSGDRHFPGEG